MGTSGSRIYVEDSDGREYYINARKSSSRRKGARPRRTGSLEDDASSSGGDKRFPSGDWTDSSSNSEGRCSLCSCPECESLKADPEKKSSEDEAPAKEEPKLHKVLGSVSLQRDSEKKQKRAKSSSLHFPKTTKVKLEDELHKLLQEEVAKLRSRRSAAPHETTSSETEVCTVPFVVAYDELLSGPFKAFLDCSNKIGGDVAEISKIVESTFKTQRAFLVAVAKSKKPSDSELPKVLEPTGKKIEEVISYRESHRTSPFSNHLAAISESIPGLSWVAVEPTPAPYVKDMGDAAVFYTNRVLKDYREKDKLHVDWVQNWNSVFTELQSYIKQYHTTGLLWNHNGGNALENLKSPPVNSVPQPPAGNIPPPPPMVPLQPKPIVADDGRAALFDDINKGTEITSGLKKVSDDLKTHKNPALREGPKPFVKPVTGKGEPVVNSNVTHHPPKLSLEGKKWSVEYQSNQPNLVIGKTSMDQSVYIYKCENTVVQVKGKINSIVLDSSKKTSVVFDTLVSAVEIVNCQSCQVQVMQSVPTVAIEKTDGCQVYLSQGSLHTEIISAKSSEMNVLIPTPDGEFTECPIPEQYKTTIDGNKLVTVCTEKAA